MKQNGKQKAELNDEDDVILTPSKRRKQIVENVPNSADRNERRQSVNRRQKLHE